MIFMQGPNYFGPKFLRAHISWGPKVRSPNESGDHFSYSLHKYFMERLMTDKNTMLLQKQFQLIVLSIPFFFLSKHQSLVLVILVYGQDRHKFDHALTLTIDSESFH